MSKPAELKQAREEEAYWRGIFKPLGCSLIGWSYKHTAQMALPSGKYLSIDSAMLELINCAKAAGRAEVLMDEHRLSDAYLRLRAMIPGAFDTPHAPTPEQIWEITERSLVAALTAAQGRSDG